MKSLTALSLLLLFNITGLVGQDQSEPVARTAVLNAPAGKMVGEMLDEESGLSLFRGIPFAEPPVGALRWKPPQELEPWEGVRECLTKGPQSVQRWRGNSSGSEDCLYLNVWTHRAGDVVAKRPVMVWIHGGGWNVGQGARPHYSGTAITKRDVLLVTVNYRLGAMGFLAHPALSNESERGISGNYGLMDNILALRWIKENIHAFGGDPGNITIFGESAGGASVSALCCIPEAKGLFHKAISQSPWMFGYTNSLAALNIVHQTKHRGGAESAEEFGQRWAAGFTDKKGADAIAELRSIDARKLFKGYYAAKLTVDGIFLPDHPLEMFKRGEQFDLPMMVGTTQHEGNYFQGGIRVSDRSAFEAKLTAFYGEKRGKALTAAFPGDARPAAVQFVTDSWFLHPTRIMLRGMEQMKSPAYQYEFRRVNHKDPSKGAPHAIEIRYVFNSIENAQVRPLDQALSDKCTDYWTQFAKTGNPNQRGLPQWPVYDSKKRAALTLDHIMKVEYDLSRTALDALDEATEGLWSARD